MLESFANKRSSMEEKSSEYCVALISSELKNKISECRNSKSTGDKKPDHDCSGFDSNPPRSKLMAGPPVMKWGSFLDNRGSNRYVLANQRGLELEGHWGRVDYDAATPAEKIAELNVQATVYKEDPVEIQPCHAPLKEGLCTRKDLRVCPFHGPITPRDDEGKPNYLNPTEDMDPESRSCNSSLEEITPALVEKLAKQAVKNVCHRDKDAAMKRQRDKQDLKRAKLAKVREHNEAVIRDAALVSTSRTSYIGEDTDTASGPRSLARNKGGGTLIMLKKKESAKERLAQKLLLPVLGMLQYDS